MQQQPKIRILEAIRQGQVGGGETHILNLVEHIDRTRFEPVVLAFTGGQMIDRLGEIGIRNFVIPSTRPFDVFKWQAVRRLMQQEAIDIVHVHGTRANSNVYWAAKALGLPVIYTIHGWSFHDDQSWLTKKLRIFYEQWITRKVNRNISVSDSNQQTGSKYIAHFKSDVINNGINLRQFNPAAVQGGLRSKWGIAGDTCVVGFAARMTEQKDPLTLISAFQQALAVNSNMVLLMVGDGELKQQAIALAATLGIDSKVIFEPFRADVPEVLQAMDIFCLPSLWEGLPIGLLEAMAMEKAVVATAADGSCEIVQHDSNGLIVPVQDAAALAAALVRLAGDAGMRARYGQAARATVAGGFDVDNMTRKIENIYLQTLAN
ncbi:glycosyltransferase family 4 protein [Deminuibacter soli]|uniref:Glycosyltransferase family 1 protein n=1 Tax=Deminuibacter soli TaxID=2291815 RepID=A0A3E1NQE4_9BACT|nr:glycosyltransferase family 4 protein [Deminuibacter soli]RFM30179.1 glycosyltransferase family 1 protein [Deminuibacter soli]